MGTAMPLFFFHTHNGHDIIDDEGTFCADLDEARVEAIKAAGEMIRDQSRDLWVGESWLMQVRDENGITVCELSFSAR